MIIARTITREFEAAADTITLDETARHRRRMKMTSDGGIGFLLDLEAARLLQHGDGIKLNDGRIVMVKAAVEPLYEVRGAGAHHLLVLAWHLGNRHLAAQIRDDHILIRQDHIIKAMLEGLGATVTDIIAPFDPEHGAYGDKHSGHTHRHHHGDAHA